MMWNGIAATVDGVPQQYVALGRASDVFDGLVLDATFVRSSSHRQRHASVAVAALGADLLVAEHVDHRRPSPVDDSNVMLKLDGQ